MSEQKTHAEIIAEMRFHGQQNIDAEKDKPEYGILTMEGRITQNYAAELDAAHKREVDALKQRINELDAEVAAKDEVIKRLDAEIRKYQEERELRIAAQKAKAAAEGYADGKRDAQVGDTAKLREAVEYCLGVLNRIDWLGDGVFPNGKFIAPETLARAKQKATAALAAPARNCNVGTAEEQLARHNAWCRKYGIDGDMTVHCAHPDMSCGLCTLRWAQLPCESEEAK